MFRPAARSLALSTVVAMSFISGRAGACPDGCSGADLCGDAHCGPATGSPPSASGAERGGDPFPVAMYDSFFVPALLTIRPSSFVRWTNKGLDVHTATRKGMFDSGIIDPGEIYDFEFTALNAGFAYSYTCYLHVGMDGTITVARYGDANLDEFVNLEDFNILASNFGTNGPPWEGGDFNEDGSVNLEDFNLLAANFGKPIEIAPDPLVFELGLGTAVPEPTLLPFTSTFAFMLRRRPSYNVAGNRCASPASP